MGIAICIEFKRFEYDQVPDGTQSRFLALLQSAYEVNYGDDYHLDRIRTNKCTVFIGEIRNSDEVVCGCYVKQNGRRCATVVSEQYREAGLASSLILFSLNHIQRQYSIVQRSHYEIVNVLEKVGFNLVTEIDELRGIASAEFSQFSLENFGAPHFEFTRTSERRGTDASGLIMLQKGFAR